MRALIQRVSEASVTIQGKVKSQIDQGLLVLVGVEDADEKSDVEWLCNKLVQMRLFSDADGKMNLSVKDVEGQLLVISQFTLHASVKKGNRPSFIKAAKPDKAIPLYEYALDFLSVLMPGRIGSGEFGADMKVALINDGPVTIWMDSKNRE